MKSRTWLRLMLLVGCGSFLLIPHPLFALDPARSVFQYNCQNWSRQDGLPADGINSITQTRDGFLWLGTQKGLVRFDGIQFTTFSLPDQPQFRGQIISTLWSARAGALWFGIQGGSLGSYTEAAGFGTPHDQWWLDPTMNVTAIREISDGSMWAGTDKGAVRWVNGNTNQTRFFEQLPGVLRIYEDPHGRVWLGTSDRGLFYWQEGKLTAFSDATLEGALVSALAEDWLGQLWVGTKTGLRCYDANFHRKELPPSYTEVKALKLDRHGVLWIGTTGDGLLCYKNGRFTPFRKSDGLANDTVTSLFEDQEGSLWIGTRNGLSQLSDVKFPIYSATEGLPGGLCHGVCASTNGALWAATSRGISHFDGTRARNYSTEAGLTIPYVKQVFEAGNGDVYLLNGNKEIEILSRGKVVARYSHTNMPTALAEDSQGVLVAVGGDLFRVSRRRFTPYEFKQDPPPPFYWIRSLHSCRDGSVLVASVNGLFRLKDGNFEHWTVENGLSDYNVLCVCEDSQGTVWAGLTTGICRLQGNKIQCVSRDDGLFDNSIYAIVPDDRGWLWINSSRGIFRVSRETLDTFFSGQSNQIACVAYDGLEAVKTIDTTEVEYSGCRTSDGLIWFPSPQGLVRIDPANLLANPFPPPIHIQRVLANGVELTAHTRSTTPVPAGKGDLEFQYAAPSFIAPRKVQFRYRLEGYEPGWVNAGFRRSAFFTNLKPGRYRFHVQASNADGIWNADGDSFDIVLPPHFHQQAWFRILCGLIGIAALLGLYTWRVRHLWKKERKLQQTNELLEGRIQERTRELAEQRNLLRTLIDHLPDNIFVKDTQSRIVLDNLAHARNLGAENTDAVVGKTDFDFFPRDLAEKFYADEQVLLQTGQPYDGEEYSVLRPSGQSLWTRTTKVPLRDSQGKIIGLAGINRDITERKQWEARLESLHKQLLDSSRHAGMAEVATSVLHNVGNVLNSVNVSASIVEEKIRRSGAAKLAKVSRMLRDNERDLARFLSQDDKGKQLIRYLETFIEHLATEKSEMLTEIKGLVRNVEHIKEIVVMQQTYAKVAGIIEITSASELLEDALRMHAMAYERHAVKVFREYSKAPPIAVDRHKAIQILVNLLQNAKYACEAKQADDRKVTLRTEPAGPDRVRIEVTDNGIGIPPQNLTRIFSHGFTTRKGGHGYGLHSGALAAREMGGSLTVHSDGAGKGASFTLELPLHHPQKRPATARDSSNR